jgi:hypothetical protein
MARSLRPHARMRAVWLAIMLAVAQGSAHPDAGAERLLGTAETLLGAWNGRWLGQDRAAQGSMGLVVARTPRKDAVVGQFTFVIGGTRVGSTRDASSSRSSATGGSYSSRSGGGRAGTAPRLRGEWTDARGALPARQGVIELVRTD